MAKAKKKASLISPQQFQDWKRRHAKILKEDEEKLKRDPTYKILDKWHRTPTETQRKKDEDQIKRDPAFTSAWEKLQDAHPLITHTPSGSVGCREFRNKADESAWSSFCDQWSVQLRPLMWGSVEKTNPIPARMDFDVVGRPVKTTYGAMSAQHKRDYRLIELLYERYVYGDREREEWGTKSKNYQKRSKDIIKGKQILWDYFRHERKTNERPPACIMKEMLNPVSGITQKVACDINTLSSLRKLVYSPRPKL